MFYGGQRMTDMCIEAANRLVDLTNDYNVGRPYGEKIIMSCKRLQKLLYFSEVAYMLRTNGTPMFADDFYAWPSGPVIPSVYSRFVQFQTGEMARVEGSHTPITEEMKSVLDYIFRKTIDISTSTLVTMSHVKGGPWDSVYDSDDPEHLQIIDKTVIYNFYQNRNIFA